MCWCSRNKPELKIANRDIPVFKVVLRTGNTLTSIYQGFKYEEGVTYRVVLDKVYREYRNYKCARGFHSYSSKDCHIHDYIVLNNNKDALAALPKYLNMSQLVCTIPKGSEYYLNEHGEYVSNKIKVIKAHVLV